MHDDFRPPPPGERSIPELVSVVAAPVKRRPNMGRFRITSVELWTTHVTFVFAEPQVGRSLEELRPTWGWRLEDDVATSYFDLDGGSERTDYMLRGDNLLPACSAARCHRPSSCEGPGQTRSWRGHLHAATTRAVAVTPQSSVGCSPDLVTAHHRTRRSCQRCSH